MPRQLPWKVNNLATPKPPPGARQQRSTPAGSASRSPGPSSAHVASARSTPKSKSDTLRRSLGQLNGGRSPSTSPPPEPLPEEFMREGVDKDDRYRMVEDEFLAVAHDFTRHIHAAEYQRLKSLAKSQNEETIQNISRPVTGEMTELVKRRQAVLDNAKRQQRILGKRFADSDSEEEEGERDRRKGGGSSLQGLMDSPRKRVVPLISLGSGLGSPSRRRRDILTGQSQNAIRTAEPVHVTDTSSDDDDDDDDLDAGLKDWLSKHTNTSGASPREAETAARVESRLASRPSTLTNSNKPSNLSLFKDKAPKPTAQPATTHRLSDTSHIGGEGKTQIKQEDEDGDDHEGFFSRIRSRRAEMRRRSAGVKAESSPDGYFSIDDIPFL